MNTIIVYGNVDCLLYHPHINKPVIVQAVAVPNTKEGRALFNLYKEEHEWKGMSIYKDVMTIEAFNKLNEKQDNTIELLKE